MQGIVFVFRRRRKRNDAKNLVQTPWQVRIVEIVEISWFQFSAPPILVLDWDLRMNFPSETNPLPFVSLKAQLPRGKGRGCPVRQAEQCGVSQSYAFVVQRFRRRCLLPARDARFQSHSLAEVSKMCGRPISNAAR